MGALMNNLEYWYERLSRIHMSPMPDDGGLLLHVRGGAADLETGWAQHGKRSQGASRQVQAKAHRSMNQTEYRAALKRLGLSHNRAAPLLGVDVRTSKRWALGERAIPPPVARLLAYIERYGMEVAREFVERENEHPK